jgi:serine protease Do
MPQGVFIYKLTEGSTAQNSGLQPKDIITAVDGQGITSYDDLASLLSKYKAGETVKVTVQRPNGANYDEVVVDVVLGSSKSSNTNTPQQSSGNSGDSGSSPFDRPQNGSENNPSENPNGNSGSYDNEELWKQFEKFFNQYQR